MCHSIGHRFRLTIPFFFFCIRVYVWQWQGKNVDRVCARIDADARGNKWEARGLKDKTNWEAIKRRTSGADVLWAVKAGLKLSKEAWQRANGRLSDYNRMKLGCNLGARTIPNRKKINFTVIKILSSLHVIKTIYTPGIWLLLTGTSSSVITSCTVPTQPYISHWAKRSRDYYLACLYDMQKPWCSPHDILLSRAYISLAMDDDANPRRTQFHSIFWVQLYFSGQILRSKETFHPKTNIYLYCWYNS